MNAHFTPLSVLSTLKLAWSKTKGVKTTIWLTIFLGLGVIFGCIAADIGFGLVLLVVSTILHHFLNTGELVITMMAGVFTGALMLVSLGLFVILTLFLTYAMTLIGLKCARSEPIKPSMLFALYEQPKKVFFYVLGLALLLAPISLGFSFLRKKLFALLSLHIMRMSFFGLGLLYSVGILLLIYLFLRLNVSLMFIVDKKLNPIAAIKASFKATQNQVIKLGLLCLSFYFIYFFLIISVVGIIWAIPFAFVFHGAIYVMLTSPENVLLQASQE